MKEISGHTLGDWEPHNVKVASKVLEQAGEFARNNKNLLTGALVGAGAGGLAGGYMSSRTKERPGETRGSRRKRILRDALLMAGAGGAAAGLGGAGLKSLGNALPKGDTDPVTNVFTSPFGRGVMGAGTGGVGWLASKKWIQNPKAMQLLDRTGHNLKPDSPQHGRLNALMAKLDKSDAKTRLGALLQSKLRGLVPSGEDDLKAIDKLGLPLPMGKKKFERRYVEGITDHLGPVGGMMRDVGDRIAKTKPGAKFVQSSAGKGLKRLSHSAWRHPGVAAAVAAGALAPELISGMGMVPGIPNPLHRE